MRILGISGSLRAGSFNSATLDAAELLLPPEVELRRFHGLADLPAYNDDLHEPGPCLGVKRLRTEIATADGLLIATPEYNASVPGALKNALDWASRPFPWNALRGKPVAVLGASTGMFGAVWAQAEVRKVLQTIGAVPLETELAIPHADTALAGGKPTAELEGSLRELLAELIRAIHAAGEPQRFSQLQPAIGR